MSNEFKDETRYLFDGIIKIKSFDSNKIKID